jgi:hypothetical protein
MGLDIAAVTEVDIEAAFLLATAPVCRPRDVGLAWRHSAAATIFAARSSSIAAASSPTKGTRSS